MIASQRFGASDEFKIARIFRSDVRPHRKIMDGDHAVPKRFAKRKKPTEAGFFVEPINEDWLRGQDLNL